MSQFDVFTSVPEPKINISLFGDAAAQGVQVGNALPTKTTSIIRGAQEGVETGLNYLGKIENIQSANLQQERTQQIIDAEPLEQQYRQEQLTRMRNLNALEEQQIKLAQLTQDNETKLKIIQADNAVKEAEQKSKDIDIERDITAAVSSNDKAQRLSIMNNPAQQDYLFRKPDFGRQVLGALYNDMTPEQREGAMARIDYVRKMQLDAQKKALQDKLDSKIINGYEKDEQALLDEVDLKDVVKGKDADQLLQIEVVPTGTYKVDSKTGLKTGAGSPVAGMGYDFFEGDKRIATGRTHSAANTLSGFQNSYTKYTELLQERLAPDRSKGAQAQSQAPEAQISQVSQIQAAPKPPASEGAARLGIPQQTISDVSTMAQTSAKDAGWLERNLPTWLRDSPVERALTETINATPDDQKVKAAIEDTAAVETRKVLDSLKTGTAEDKQTVRDWAEAQGVELTPQSLNAYFKYKIKDSLSGVYEEAYAAGLDKRAAQNRTQSAISAQQELDTKSLEGRTLSEAQAIRRTAREKLGMEETPSPTPTATPTPGAPQQTAGGAPLPGQNAVPATVALTALTRQAAQKVFDYAASAIGLNPKSASTKDYADRVTGVLTNQFLAASPTHVKAVAAVESGGKSDAVSPTGVKGLMQVSRKVASSYGLNRNIPEENVEAGTKYLTDLIKMFGGEKALAYAAYNTGPGVIRYAQRLANGSSDWKVVKKHLYAALQKYEKQIGVPAAEKLKETFNYPEKVMLHESLFDKAKAA